MSAWFSAPHAQEGAWPPGPADGAHVAGGIDADVRKGEEHVPLLAIVLHRDKG